MKVPAGIKISNNITANTKAEAVLQAVPSVFSKMPQNLPIAEDKKSLKRIHIHSTALYEAKSPSSLIKTSPL